MYRNKPKSTLFVDEKAIDKKETEKYVPKLPVIIEENVDKVNTPKLEGYTPNNFCAR